MNQYPYYPGHPAQQPQPQQFSLYGLPTPNQNTQADDAFDPLTYQAPFDPTFNPAAAAAARPFAPPPQSPPDSYTKHSVSSAGAEHFTAGHYPNSIEGRDEFFPDPGFIPSDSEDKDGGGVGAPAQNNKRKAQNRAAQRAFRERKERHVRDLEEKVSNLTQESSTLHADNERLKRELARYSTENEILRATTESQLRRSASSTNPSSPSGGNTTTNTHATTPANIQTGPMTYTPKDFYTDLVPKGQLARLHRVTYCKETGEKLLDTVGTWEMISAHEAFKRGLLDVAAVTKRLKTGAQCDGTGPAFRVSDVREAIEESLLEGGVGEDDGLL
ncbi:hypothetical protein BJX70DRAFT_393929 [Aspergillus crustosus]